MSMAFGPGRRTAWIVLGLAIAIGGVCVLGYALAVSCLAEGCAPEPRVRDVATGYLVVSAVCLVAITVAVVALVRTRRGGLARRQADGRGS
jgi:hypothetical protein